MFRRRTHFGGVCFRFAGIELAVHGGLQFYYRTGDRFHGGGGRLCIEVRFVRERFVGIDQAIGSLNAADELAFQRLDNIFLPRFDHVNVHPDRWVVNGQHLRKRGPAGPRIQGSVRCARDQASCNFNVRHLSPRLCRYKFLLYSI